VPAAAGYRADRTHARSAPGIKALTCVDLPAPTRRCGSPGAAPAAASDRCPEGHLTGTPSVLLAR
jgi:hypothetical protein